MSHANLVKIRHLIEIRHPIVREVSHDRIRAAHAARPAEVLKPLDHNVRGAPRPPEHPALLGVPANVVIPSPRVIVSLVLVAHVPPLVHDVVRPLEEVGYLRAEGVGGGRVVEMGGRDGHLLRDRGLRRAYYEREAGVEDDGTLVLVLQVGEVEGRADLGEDPAGRWGLCGADAAGADAVRAAGGDRSRYGGHREAGYAAGHAGRSGLMPVHPVSAEDFLGEVVVRRRLREPLGEELRSSHVVLLPQGVLQAHDLLLQTVDVPIEVVSEALDLPFDVVPLRDHLQVSQWSLLKDGSRSRREVLFYVRLGDRVDLGRVRAFYGRQPSGVDAQRVDRREAVLLGEERRRLARGYQRHVQGLTKNYNVHVNQNKHYQYDIKYDDCAGTSYRIVFID